MASYVTFRDSLREDEIMDGYTGLLADIKYCINLLEELESERGYMEWVSDWVVGERSSLNIDRTRNNLKKLHKEIERGLKLHTDLFSLIPKAKMIEQSFQLRIKQLELGQMDTSQLMVSYDRISRTNKHLFDRISTAVDNLESTKLFVKREIKMKNSMKVVGVVGAVGTAAGVVGAVVGTAGAGVSLVGAAVATGGIALAAGSGIAAVTGVISWIAHSYGKKKGIKYQELKFLSDSLHDLRLLSEFEAHHCTLTEVTKGFKDNIKFYEREVTSMQTLALTTQTQAITQVLHKNLENSQASTRTLDDGIKVTRMYDRTLQENIQSLQKKEPDMTEGMRKRMATMLAETACKTFLKEKLNYTDTDSDEFLAKLRI